MTRLHPTLTWSHGCGMCMLRVLCETVRVTLCQWNADKYDHILLSPQGAGVGPTIQIGEQTVITVDAKAAGKGKVTCTVCTPEGAEVDVDVVENEDGTFDIFYTAPQPGEYVICVRFGGEHIPNSPFQVTVSPVCFGTGFTNGSVYYFFAIRHVKIHKPKRSRM